METWARTRLGDNAFEYFVRPLIEPSFGTDCRDLSVPYLQGIMKRAHLAKFFLPRDGMGSVCAALTRNVDVRLGVEVVAVDLDGAEVVVSTAQGETSRVDGGDRRHGRCARRRSTRVRSGGATEVQALRSAPYASMAHVNLRWVKNPWPANEFEMLLPIGAGPRPLLGGTIVKTSATSQLVPAGGCMTNSYFSSAATRELTDDELIETALRHVGETLGKGFPDPVAEVFGIERALAICPPGGHYRAMQELRNKMPARIGIAGGTTWRTWVWRPRWSAVSVPPGVFSESRCDHRPPSPAILWYLSTYHPSLRMPLD